MSGNLKNRISAMSACINCCRPMELFNVEDISIFFRPSV